MRRKQTKWRILLVFLLLAVFLLQEMICLRSKASILKKDTCKEEAFRRQILSSELYWKLKTAAPKDKKWENLLTATMLNGKFMPEKLDGDETAYRRFKSAEYDFLISCYQAVWKDLETFPIPARKEQSISQEISYEDTYGAPRDFGGVRTHEGCDLFGKTAASGYYPVLSMTDGTVEKIGWLPLGGYRIGIRAPHGGYFYYAHLAQYERDFQHGDQIKAGEILGYMGDTGYGEEGTTGKFPVHLHVGIYIFSQEGEEISVNPFYVLKAMEKNAKKYIY